VGSRGLVKLKHVWKMLDECAPGWKRTKTPHYWRISFKNKTYERLPLGGHGKKREKGTAEVEIGHVKKMCNLFGINECASSHFHFVRPGKNK
jgi:hypothetical protein